MGRRKRFVSADPALATRPQARRRVVRAYLPPQHGAWAMLALPFAVGVACSRPVWLHLPLGVAWFGGYLFSYYALLAVKTGKPGRVAPQLRLYGAVTALPALAVVALRPEVLAFAPAFAALLAVNALLARRHDDRALVGGIASVVQSCLMVPAAAVVAGTPPQDVAVPALAVLAYFTGSLLYVKTMIRNRGERAFLWGSVGYHAVVAAVATVVAWPLGVLGGWLLVRAGWLPRTSLTPKQVGLLEIGPILGLLVGLPLLFG